MKRKKMKKNAPISTVIVMSMMVGSLVGCSGGKDTPKETIEVEAADVAFNKDGRYTTTISAKDVKLNDLTTNNFEVYYEEFLNEYTDFQKLRVNSNSEDNSNSPNDDSEKEIDYTKLFTQKAVVENVTTDENGDYVITFIDKKTSEYTTCYYLSLKEANAYAFVDVNFANMSLTADLQSVYSGSSKFRVALTIDGGEFEDDISEADLYRTNAFEKLDLEIISKSSHNLTLNVEGEIERNVAGAYQWGILGIKASGIKNGYTDIETKIDIILDYAGFDALSLQYIDGKVRGNLKIYGVADVDSLTEDKIIIDGAIVEGLVKVDDNTLELTMTAPGAESINDFVDAINGKEMTIDTYKTAVELSQATFYPVFDKIEESGDNFEIVTKLYIYSGTISDSIDTNSVVLSGFFADGSVKSITKENDNLATLVISTPRGDMNEENYSFDGGITLLAGNLINAWGSETTKDYSYSRNYSVETLGKAVSLNNDTLLAIQQYTRGLNTTFGTICYYGGIIGQVASIGKTILEMTGTIQSDHAEVMEKLTEMNKKLDNIQTGINDIKASISKLIAMAREAKIRDLKKQVDEFETLLIDFNNALTDVSAIQQRAAFDLAMEDAVVRGQLDEVPSFAGLSAAEVAKEKERLRKAYMPITTSMSDRESAEYNVRVMNYLNQKALDINNPDYYSYPGKVQKLEELFGRICGLLDKKNSSNPITLYDELCAHTYNFDSQTYEFRLSTRVALEYQLTKAMWAFAFHYKVSHDESTLYNNRTVEYGKALNAFKLLEVTGHPASEIKGEPHWELVSNKDKPNDVTYIGGLMTSAHKDSNQAINRLKQFGYTPIYKDLNAGSGGKYVYLGYKTTTDPDAAIKNMRVVAYESGKQPAVPSGYYAVGTGINDMESSYDMNSGIKKHKTIISLYYTTDYDKGDPFTSISIVGRREDSDLALTEDLNKDVGGEYLYIHADRKPVDYRPPTMDDYLYVETNPEYHPYCYILGRKVASYCPAGPTVPISYENHVAFVKNIFKQHFRDWSEEERKDFASRMRYSNPQDELISAGFSSTGTGRIGDRKDNIYKMTFGVAFTFQDDGRGYSSWVLNYKGEFVWQGGVYTIGDYHFFLVCY